MKSPSPDSAIAFEATDARKCHEARLVLTSLGIQSAVVHKDDLWLLVVEPEDFARASAELHSYQQENAEQPIQSPSRTRVYSGATLGIAVYSAVIVVIAIVEHLRLLELDWIELGSMQAGLVRQGDWWRTVTALTLHLDVEHLLSNLLFGSVFGFLAGRVLGGGVAWLAIVIAGALGNLCNAVVQSPQHTSLGASTAVFAALGIIVAHSLRPGRETPQRPLVRWSPIIGGALLFAFIGIGGERTDVVAHVTGLLAGVAVGWFGCRISETILSLRSVQIAAGTTACIVIVLCWIFAIIETY